MLLNNPPLPYQRDRSLKEFSTFGIGGPARYFVEVSSQEELSLLFPYLKENRIRYVVIGKGSNILFDDRGFDGVVIYNKILAYKREGAVLSVGAGYSFALLGMRMAREELTGLEFASGIPGTVGGAIYMNAGIGEECVSKRLTDVTYVTEEGAVVVYRKEELEFGYRTSPFQKMRGAIAGARFSLTPSRDAKKKLQALIDYRCRTQPVQEKSAGCVFRNPAGSLTAGALIDQCGLKGVCAGGAQISPIHANFIINAGGATAGDVLALLEHIRKVVKEKKGIELVKEICFIPYVPS